ncbi:hypothetical protein [Candidatus Bathycorpusculum sp.]|uniref:hypothetical protein n=1 Tax=Candidatus Bathycorpusculum sp. TaxID=2994959 RepID=UPI00282D3DC0|nr:hypothetical protein [Candidatus Termitimicrobium sp.]MCL2685959.1 hypothetical protein [Candidatus Termitimicrobium sp.]
MGSMRGRVKTKLKITKQKAKVKAESFKLVMKYETSCLDLGNKILNGVPPLNDGLLKNKRYLALSPAGKLLAERIVWEECERHMLWKTRDMRKLAKIIEDRLRQECT